MRTRCATGLRYSPWNGCQRSKDRRVLALQSPTARFAASEYWSYTWSPIRPEMSMISAPCGAAGTPGTDSTSGRSEEHTSELQSRGHLVCRLLLEKKKK